MSDLPSPENWPIGIYFDLNEDLYHSLPFLGSTDMKSLYSSPSDFWWNSPMNALRPLDDKATAAQEFGRAVHHCILYGRERFDQVYRMVDEDGDTVSADGLKEWLRKEGAQPRKLKADNLKLIREDFGFRLMTRTRYNEVVVAAEMIKRNPHLVPAFENGWPEVSIFWHSEDGIPMKCRIDYLKARAIVDIKSFSAKSRIQPLDRMILSDILRYRYDVQVSHYQDGRRAARDLALSGKIFGEVSGLRPHPDDVIKMLAEPEPAWVFVFYKSDGMPVSKSFQVRYGSPMHKSGEAACRQAVSNFLKYREKFGTAAWVCDDAPYDIGEEDLPAWL